MSDFDVNLLKGTLFDLLFLGELLVVAFKLWKLLLDLRVTLNHFLLFILVFFDLLFGFRDLNELGFLFVVDHDVLAFKQFKVLLEVLFTAVCLFLLLMQVLDLVDEALMVMEEFFLLVTLGLDLISTIRD